MPEGERGQKWNFGDLPTFGEQERSWKSNLSRREGNEEEKVNLLLDLEMCDENSFSGK